MKCKQSIVDQRHVALTFGLLLLTTITGLETLAVTTIASTIAKELGGIALYSWIFSASLLAQMVGTVVAGHWADQRGIRHPFITSLGTFAVGILVASLASNMPMFIVARALQGLGAGGLLNSVYTSINLNYDDRSVELHYPVKREGVVEKASIHWHTVAYANMYRADGRVEAILPE